MTADLVGYRALDSAGGAPVAVFDRHRLPVIRVFGPEGRETKGFSVELDFGGNRTTSKVVAEPREGLILLRLPAEKGPMALGAGAVRLIDTNGQAIKTWTARFDIAPEERTEVVAVGKLRAEKGNQAAMGHVQTLLASASAQLRPWLLAEQARIQAAGDDPEAAAAAWAKVADAALAARIPTEATRGWRAAAHQLWTRRRFPPALALLDRAEALDREIGNEEGLFRMFQTRAHIAGELGDFRRAAALYSEAASGMRRLGLDVEASSPDQGLANVLQAQGQHRAALATLERAGAVEWTKPTLRADYENNLAWAQLEAMAKGAIPRNLAGPRALLLAARERFKAAGDRPKEAIVTSNLAWAAFLDDDPKGARTHLAEFRTLDAQGRGFAALFAASLEGELCLVEKNSKGALSAFRLAARLALDESGGLDSDFGWRARYGLGRAHEAAGDHAAALAEFRAALSSMERVGARTVFQVGRSTFFDDRRSLVDDLLRLLLAQGDVVEAFTVAEAAQAHVLRAMEGRVRVESLSTAQRAEWTSRVGAYLDERQRYEASQGEADLLGTAALAQWEVKRKADRESLARAFDAAYGFLDQAAPTAVPQAADARRIIAALAPDEALLTFVALGGKRTSFLVFGGRIRSAPVTTDLLGPWAADLQHIRHLFVAPVAAPEAFELPARRGPDGLHLLRSVGVSFVPHAGFLLDRAARSAPRGGLAVIVADPAQNLPQALAEGAFVASKLPGSRLLSGDAADRDTVLQALSGAPLFHFAGHGVLHPEQPWEAHLQLAGEHRLTLADLLAAHPRLGTVVLSGCETGRHLALGRHESVGLPEAFLGAGARTVIATRSPVKDADARRFTERFYAEGGATTPGLAFRAAALALEAAGDPAWSEFQLYGLP